MRSPISVALVSLLIIASPAAAAEEPLVDQVKKAIDDGVRFLKERQQKVSKDADGNGPGHWEVDVLGRRGGPTCLAMLVLLSAGEDPKSDAIQRGLKWLRELELVDTYVVGLQTMVFAEAREKQDFQRIQRNINWLLDARVMKNGRLSGWSYHKNGRYADNSNTQFALLGLHAGKLAGAKIDKEVWESIREFYLDTQNTDGGWPYLGSGNSTLTMTTAGLCGLLMAGMELNDARRKLRPDGSAKDCGVYAENEAIASALQALNDRFSTRYSPAWFYNLHDIERAGRLSGHRFFGKHDWYRLGCETLVDPDVNKSHRHEDGSWYLRGTGFDGSPVVSTSFALLFLSKGRTPVLVSKLAHYPADAPNTGWNNKHNDARHLVEYVNQLGLFKQNQRPQPVAWQVFNIRQTGRSDPEALAAELLSSPIAFFNGHEKPVFTTAEKSMLIKYVAKGGCIVAEACCGADGAGKDFDRGFKALVHELWDDEKQHPLRKLPANHPIYTAHFRLTPDDFPLYGMDFDNKTLVIYSPTPLAGWWEANETAKGTRGEKAFQLGVNIVVYATGRNLPKPRGSEWPR